MGTTIEFIDGERTYESVVEETVSGLIVGEAIRLNHRLSGVKIARSGVYKITRIIPALNVGEEARQRQGLPTRIMRDRLDVTYIAVYFRQE